MAQEKTAQENKRHASFGAIFSSALLVIACVLAVSILTQVRSKGYATVFGYSTFRVVTGSMEPEIPIGALLLCHTEPIEKLQVGDIVCFTSQSGATQGWVITHRVTAVLGEGDSLRLETRGDANAVSDTERVTRSNLIGKVVGHTGEESALAKLIAFITSGSGFLGMILFPCLLIAGLLMRRSVKSIRGEIKEMEDAKEAELWARIEKEDKAEAYGISYEEYVKLEQEVKAELENDKERIRKELEEELRREIEAEMKAAAEEQDAQSADETTE